MKFITPVIVAISAFFLCQCKTNQPQTNTIQVSSSQELLDAIGPDRTIKLAAGSYDLTPAAAGTSEHHLARYVFDGFERVVKNVNGLRLVGGSGVKIHVGPRYAYVFNFEGCRDITIENIFFTHTPDQGYCSGGVLNFENCSNINISNCVLDGCGTEGITARNVSGLAMSGSTIQNCTYGIMTLSSSSNVQFKNSKFTNNVKFDLVNVDDCKGVSFDSCQFKNNRASLDWDYALFNVSGSFGVQLKNSSLTENMAPYFEKTKGSVEVVNTEQTANTFPKGEFRN